MTPVIELLNLLTQGK